MDVAVRKPGNVSLHSAGHDMRARQFLDSARASAPALFDARAGVGARIQQVRRQVAGVHGHERAAHLQHELADGALPLPALVGGPQGRARLFGLPESGRGDPPAAAGLPAYRAA